MAADAVRRTWLQALAIAGVGCVPGCGGDAMSGGDAGTGPVIETVVDSTPLPSAEFPFKVGAHEFASDRFQAALDALTPGATLLIRGRATHRVTGILRVGQVSLRSVGGLAVLDGGLDQGFPSQGKALIVQQSSDVRYEGLGFTRVRVADANGAGVRLEGSGTNVFSRCEFSDSDEGLLTRNDDPGCHVRLEGCTGTRLGAGDGYSHGVYCGTIGSLTVVGGRWEDAKVGHLIKSRASRTRIEGVTLIEGEASRALDLPNGGVVEILGCTFVQSDATNNSQLIGYGLEVGSAYWPENAFAFRGADRVTDSRTPPGELIATAGWFTGPHVIEPYALNDRVVSG